jgi:hypothetical protein
MGLTELGFGGNAGLEADGFGFAGTVGFFELLD